MALKAHLCVAEARQVINKKEGDFMIFTEISRLNRINLRPLCKKSKPKMASKKRPQKNKKRLWHNEIK